MSLKKSTQSRDYGQFYTKQNEYIFSGFEIPPRITRFVEPFCGQGDLVMYLEKWMRKNRRKIASLDLYDIDPRAAMLLKDRTVTVRDTLAEPPRYSGAYVVTNPPYRARNKSRDKTLFDQYGENDLYKCFLRSMIIDSENVPIGGQVIVPLNFISSMRASDCKLRDDFLRVFRIVRMNIFEEQVFEDTSYTVCAFQFLKKTAPAIEIQRVSATVFPSKSKLELSFDPEMRNIAGGAIYFLEQDPTIKIRRLLQGDEDHGHRLFLSAIDDGKNGGARISLKVADKPFFGKSTTRAYATLVTEPPLSLTQQQAVADQFNKLLNEHREQFNSLFLLNYRESKEYSRKRIPFDLAYRIVNHLCAKILRRID